MSIVRPFRRLLIANRGEIAVRIARAARAAGIVPLGIYSDADARAYHLETVDDAVRIGPGEAAESYLDVERVLEAARSLGADAVHPGYGFLAERAPFARACEAAGLVFVGPPSAAIEAMGDKAEAKRRARAHEIPVVPGYDGEDLSPGRLEAEARRIGLPLLVKATAGGGGRGMRVVSDLAELDEALTSARREARASFGDDRVLLERYVERPRHVEIQIVADAHGTVLAFGERDCSIQRRHQKVIEEAPSPVLTPELRARMTEAAVRAARSVGYVNAGTVEFLLDSAGAFFFLEMNARLQVEHPVTELVHDVDLVRLQLDVAAGARLDPALAARGARGWAIEVRILAEDAAQGGRPAVGRIERWVPPAGDGLRLDSGVRSGSEVSIFYDSLLAKLIAFGADRPEALGRLRRALEAFEVDGLPTNLPLLRAIARDAAFAAGETTTAFLEERAASLAVPGPAASADVFVLAAAALATEDRTFRIGRVGTPVALRSAERAVRATLTPVGTADPETARVRWRLAGDLTASFTFERAGDRYVVVLDAAEASEAAEPATGSRRIAGRVTLDLGAPGDPRVVIELAESTVRLRPLPPPRVAPSTAGGAAASGAIVAPMPGRVVRVAVAPGDLAIERQLLVVLEAMKMEHRIVAPLPGTVRAVHASEGAIVKAGTVLVEID